jgi:RNA polymerase sigma factor (sigma-70 family)
MQEFLAHFARDHDQILEHIVVLLHDFHDAEDVFQRTSLILWQKFDQFDPQQGSFLSWACGVAYYEVRNFLRVAARDRLRFSEEFSRHSRGEGKRMPRPFARRPVAARLGILIPRRQPQCIEGLTPAGPKRKLARWLSQLSNLSR